MMVTLQYMLVLLGVIYIITQSAIFVPVRKLVARRGTLATTLIYCPACTGFWVGATMGYLNMWPFEQNIYLAILQSAIGACALGALWKEYGPSDNVYELEQGVMHDDPEQEEASYDEEEANR